VWLLHGSFEMNNDNIVPPRETSGTSEASGEVLHCIVCARKPTQVDTGGTIYRCHNKYCPLSDEPLLKKAFMVSIYEEQLARASQELASERERKFFWQNMAEEKEKMLKQKDARIIAMFELLKDLHVALKAEPVMNNMKYDGLGVRLNRILSKSTPEKR